MTQMTPPEIVSELDKHIVGQDKAKKAVAIALRNRWRRAQVAEPLRSGRFSIIRISQRASWLPKGQNNLAPLATFSISPK